METAAHIRASFLALVESVQKSVDVGWTHEANFSMSVKIAGLTVTFGYGVYARGKVNVRYPDYQGRPGKSVTVSPDEAATLILKAMRLE